MDADQRFAVILDLKVLLWYKQTMKYLSSKPDVMGGDLVIKGTRIPIEVILYRLADGQSISEIHELYPTPTLPVLKGAIREAVELVTPQLHDKTLL